MKHLLVICVGLGCLFSTACRTPQTAEAPPADKSTTEAKANKDEVVLSPQQQTAAFIETREAAVSQEPDLLRVKGHLALADEQTWRVGIRTPGLVIAVYVGLGDYVHKGQVLARYHADEVRDQRAVYRAAVSEVERAKSVVAQAQRNRDRAQRLLELKAGSVQQVELMQQELVNAQAAVRKAEIRSGSESRPFGGRPARSAEPTPNRKDETEDEVPIFAPADGYTSRRT